MIKRMCHYDEMNVVDCFANRCSICPKVGREECKYFYVPFTHDDYTKLEGLCDRLADNLKSLEFNNDGVWGDPYCSECLCDASDGHSDECSIGKVLAEYKEYKEAQGDE